MKETRYAVLFGMNNYKKNPLSYSVKDVADIKNVLIENSCLGSCPHEPALNLKNVTYMF